jgi:hypothetical protein
MTSFAKHSGEGQLGYGGIYILERSDGAELARERTGVDTGVMTSNGTVLVSDGARISNDDNRDC